MYGIALDIRPTGGLTFRRMPSAISYISTYPFLPPTTMSGWLRRLLMLSAGHYPETAVDKPDYFTLPPGYYALGAYPTPDLQRPDVHATYRHGPMYQYNHVAFSQLYRVKPEKQAEKNKQNLQLHTWEYLIVERLRGYVLHEDAEALELLRQITNFGCKMGKEGYAYLEDTSEVKPMQKVRIPVHPTALVPAMDLVGQPSTLYTLYRYQFSRMLTTKSDVRQPSPSSIEGFVPVRAGWLDKNIELELDYWTDGEAYLPTSLVELFYG